MIELLTLGAVAGLIPVSLGLGMALLLGRMVPRKFEGILIGLATGVLVYLFFDLMHEGVELTGARDKLSWVIFLGCLGVSLVGLVSLESNQILGGRSGSRTLSLPYMIAIAMGFHNLGEGLAIGAGYASGEWAFSMLLVTGFALHNGTEGFGIVSATGKTPVRPVDVLWLALIAGGPTCIGTALSGQGTSGYLSISIYAAASGSLLYVILSLTALSYTATRRLQMAFGLFLGISLMFVTAMVLTLVSGVRT